MALLLGANATAAASSALQGHHTRRTLELAPPACSPSAVTRQGSTHSFRKVVSSSAARRRAQERHLRIGDQVSRGASVLPVCQASTSQMQASSNTEPTPEVLYLWKTADAVCFDVDSTVCTDEGIDELAAYLGKGEAVAAWTTKAMTGNVLFQDALAARLDIMKPSASDLAGYLANNPPKLSPGIKELVDAIKSRGAEVYLVSGGFRQMIEPVAALLGIPKTLIFANMILFDGVTGDYAGFDTTEPTSRAGGKATAIEQIKKERGFKTLVMLGDGATDLEARRPGGADAFIGYGGIQVRPKVEAEADWFVRDFQNLIKALQ